MLTFSARIKIIGINPFVSVPNKVLTAIFKQASRDKGRIPVRGTINDIPYRQTLVVFRSAWRLYINTTMLNNSPKRIGETITITIEFDAADRTIKPHPKFVKALKDNQKARTSYESLRPSLQREIVRYLSSLKKEESVDRNVAKAIDFLLGKGRFVGRDRP